MNPPQGLMSRRKTQYLSIFLTTRIFSIMSTGMIDILASVLICPHTKIWLCRCITTYDMAWIMLNGQLVRHVIYGKHFLDCGPIFLTSCQEGGNITVDTLFLVKASSQTELTWFIANQINREGNPMDFPYSCHSFQLFFIMVMICSNQLNIASLSWMCLITSSIVNLHLMLDTQQ